MPLRNGIPFIWRPKGLSDAIDGTNAFDGAMASLSNLIPDPTTESVWVPRPPAMSATTFSGFSSPGFVSSELIIGNRVYGTVASARNSGKDEPYCYDLQAAAFVTVSNITNANTPTQPPTTGDWTPPILFQAGSRIIVTHPGFPGGNTKFGWFDVSGFSTTTLGDTVNGSAVITGNPQVLGMQPGLAITGAGIAGSTTILTTAQAFTGISVTANTHSNFTMDSISPNTAAMRVGFQVIGPGIEPFTTITSITSGSAIQLSQATTSSVTAQSFYVLGPPTSPLSYLNVTLTAGSPTVATSDTTGVWTGQIVTDPTGGIPPGSIVVSVNPGVSFTINQNATLTGQTGSVQLTGTVIILSANATATADNITFNVSGGSFAAPQWGAGDTQPNNLPSVPVGGAQMNGRAYYACGTDGIAFSDSLFPCQISDTNQVQALKPNDGLAVTAIGPSSLASLVGGQVQSLYAFEGIFKIQQITGDPDTNNLAMNALPVATGTLAPLTLTAMESGLAFVSPDGLRIVDLIGRVSPPIGEGGQGIATPFIYALNPSRMCAASARSIIRITVHNGNKVSQPYEEYWYDLKRKIWHGPHTSTASLIQPWQDEFVLTLVGVNAELFTSAAVPQPPGGGYIENGKQLIWQYEPVYLMPDIGDMAMRATIQMTLACGGPDCDPTAAPENLLYTPPAIGQPPVQPPGTPIPPNQPPPPPTQPPVPPPTPPIVVVGPYAALCASGTIGFVAGVGSGSASFNLFYGLWWPNPDATPNGTVLTNTSPYPGLQGFNGAYAMSSDASIVVGSDNYQAVYWNRVANTRVLVDAANYARVSGCKSDGTIFVGFINGAGGFAAASACWWDKATLTRTILPPLPGDGYAIALCCSPDGSLVGGQSFPGNDGGGGKPCYWNRVAGTVHALPNGLGGFGQVTGIANDNDTLVGSGMSVSGVTEGAVWWAIGANTITRLAGGTNPSTTGAAVAISSDGTKIAGTQLNTLFPYDVAGYWTRAGGAFTALPLPIGYTITQAFGISLDGHTITGSCGNLSPTVACWWNI